MPETETNPAKPPCFPCVGAVLCAACVGAAGWTWMRYSFCWAATPEALCEAYERGAPWDQRYVVVRRGRVVFVVTHVPVGREGAPVPWASKTVVYDGHGYTGHGIPNPLVCLFVEAAPEAVRHVVSDKGRSIGWQGRVRFPRDRRDSSSPTLDMTASRFTGASIAGLVVGAMGVFVFTVALRHWLRERRAIMAVEGS